MAKTPKIPYPGAKGRLAPTLVSLMPEKGGHYVEPFAGRGNVFWEAASTPLNFTDWWLNDISTAGFFRALQECRIKVPERTREEYQKQKTLFAKGNLKAILLEPYLTFSGGGYLKAGFGGKRSATRESYANTLQVCRSLMDDCSPKITSQDWQTMGLDQLTPDDFVFFDPPYFGSDVRAYSSRDFDYPAFVAELKRAKYKWMLSEYRQPFYTKALGQPVFEKEVQLACDRKGTFKRVECVWRNF